VRETAPKIVSFEIPLDKIGEVIGPKGKVINTITQETGADVSVSDDGIAGTVSIGSKDGAAVEEARRRIELILDPPTAELGANYTGRVVNVTKFGAFVNILPGRDGLLHISKLGRGKRIDRVEDVLNLGDEVEVRVDDIDNSGKLSLSLVGDDSEESSDRDADSEPRPERAPREEREPREPREAPAARESGGDGNGSTSGSGDASADREVASFEDQWESQAKEEFGDLGPAEPTRERSGSGGGSRRGSGGGGRRGGGGGGRGRR
jgi:polyribonucleotide nucleotidyltransferase